MDQTPIRIIRHEGSAYVDVHQFVDIIITDLMKTPVTMLVTRDGLINALLKYAKSASDAMETS